MKKKTGRKIRIWKIKKLKIGHRNGQRKKKKNGSSMRKKKHMKAKWLLALEVEKARGRNLSRRLSLNVGPSRIGGIHSMPNSPGLVITGA
jgi:hypothetical protein